MNRAEQVLGMIKELVDLADTSEAKMSKADAVKVLKSISRKKVSDYYDDMTDEESDALTALIPGFEYPDISHMTFGELIKKNK